MGDWTGRFILSPGWGYYHGPTSDVDFHRHHAIQICISGTSSLTVELDDQRIVRDPVVVVGSDIAHRIRTSQDAAHLFYVEPSSMLGRLVLQGMCQDSIFVPDEKVTREVCARFDQPDLAVDNEMIAETLLILFPQTESVSELSPMDDRIRRALDLIEKEDLERLVLAEIAERCGLSESRFRHLFSLETGLSYSSFMLWMKMQRAILNLGVSKSLTEAAHVGGFSDSAHLARTFRRMFGFAASDLTKQASFSLSP